MIDTHKSMKFNSNGSYLDSTVSLRSFIFLLCSHNTSTNINKQDIIMDRYELQNLLNSVILQIKMFCASLMTCFKHLIYSAEGLTGAVTLCIHVNSRCLLWELIHFSLKRSKIEMKFASQSSCSKQFLLTLTLCTFSHPIRFQFVKKMQLFFFESELYILKGLKSLNCFGQACDPVVKLQ